MRDVHDLGPFYCWGGRYAEEMKRSVQFGRIRNIEPPFRTGRGVEVQLGEFVIGFGFVNVFQRKMRDEDAGLQRVGLLSETEILATGEEIGEWDGTPAATDQTDEWFRSWDCLRGDARTSEAAGAEDVDAGPAPADGVGHR